ncbi:MAG TPA: S53 family peptidase, partial [Steroidobacteraceae bacterium]
MANPDFSAKVRLGGHLPGWVRAENTAAQAVPVSAPLNVTVVLKRDAGTQAAFDQLLAEQQTPGSALYHQWLTPAQVGSMFGVAPADMQAVENWLESQGLKVTRVEPNGLLLDVTGSVAAVSGAFRTNFAEFRVGAETRLSATEEPSVPQALQAVIAGVHGLSQSTLHPQSIAMATQGQGLRVQGQGETTVAALTAEPQMTAPSGGHYLTPNDFAAIYDLGSVYSGGNTGATVAGKAQRVAIVGRSRVAATDISQFESMTGLPSAQPNVIVPAGGIEPGTTNSGDQDEATLDVDRVMGTAPGVGVDLVVSADSRTVSGIYTAAAYAVNTLVDPVLSISFGDCEANAGQQGVSVWDTLFSAAAAEGISVMVSSGDSGAAGCDGNSQTLPVTQTASINYICSSSYVTCVGGTQFADTSSAGSYWSAQNGSGQSSATGYIPEGAWNEPMSGSKYVAAGTGGGASAYIAKPSWQTGTGVPADGMRDVPDVSLSSATHDGYLACLAYAGGDCSQQKFEVFGGTSAAAPGMAGIVALMNTATGSAAGNVNPLLYRLAADA